MKWSILSATSASRYINVDTVIFTNRLCAVSTGGSRPRHIGSGSLHQCQFVSYAPKCFLNFKARSDQRACMIL